MKTDTSDQRAEPSPARPSAQPASRAGWPRLAAGVVVVASVGLALVFGSRFGEDPTLVPSPLMGKEIPSLELPRLDGQGTLSFDDLRGNILVVNFWASWCLACRAEHPDLVATAEAYRDSGVKFVGIVYQDDPASARGFLDELGWGYDYVLDPESRAAIAFGVFGVPETFFVDPQGVIVGKITGQSNAVLLSQSIDAIREGAAPGERTVGTVQSSPDQ